MGIKGRVLVRVTWCHPPGQAGLVAIDSMGGAQSGTKIATAFSPEGNKEICQKPGEREVEMEGERGQHCVLTAVSGAADFSHHRTFPPAGTIADFQLCADMFPSSAHINDTLVSIVTAGE